MTAGLETFAKVRALYDGTSNLGERAAAAGKMKTLARKAGMTVAQAVAALDAPKPPTRTQAFASSFQDFMNRPEFVAERIEREAQRRVEAAAIVKRYGSKSAVFADTPREVALRAACAPLLGPGEAWDQTYHLDGWGSLDGRAKMPASVRDAVSRAWPQPATVAEAWAEFSETERLTSDRYIVDRNFDPHRFTDARRYVVEGLCNTLPARSLQDLRARLAWMEFWVEHEVEQDRTDARTNLASLRGDIERMGARLREQDVTDRASTVGTIRRATP